MFCFFLCDFQKLEISNHKIYFDVLAYSREKHETINKTFRHAEYQCLLMLSVFNSIHILKSKQDYLFHIVNMIPHLRYIILDIYTHTNTIFWHPSQFESIQFQYTTIMPFLFNSESDLLWYNQFQSKS